MSDFLTDVVVVVQQKWQQRGMNENLAIKTTRRFHLQGRKYPQPQKSKQTLRQRGQAEQFSSCYRELEKPCYLLLKNFPLAVTDLRT